MNEPLISVIVPVYKVEQYLRQCVDSILAQTHTNLEVILVDDGSPDNCGAICDEYAARDARVVVIHKENEGVSAARNSGLDIAKGEYIGLVDSDDWIERDMYESMLCNMVDNNCDIATCGRLYSYSSGEVAGGYVGEIGVMTPEEAVIACFSGKGISVCAWDKLYRRKVFDAIRYPVGMVPSEDSYVIVELFIQAKAIVVDNTPRYHYRQRRGSIVHSKSVKQFVNYGEGFIKVSADITAYFPHLSEYAREVYLRGLYDAVRFAGDLPGINNHPMYCHALQTLRSSLSFVLHSKYFSVNEKVKALLLNTSVPLFRMAMTVRKKVSIDGKMVAFGQTKQDE